MWLGANGKSMEWNRVDCKTHGELEYTFGDYSDGRYAWEMTNVQRMEKPVPVKGMQGLWNWEE
ncbi:hypothetical protein [Paenibacillus bouchesdurhonensis]|uniref:hypothetical protein n=1 Tax=Paenibacillus bouchesdurhonensis TaxID=1870990 RepID=UPI000DA60A61|nr:hypothetical protein [Paenibacillus bouchesdurhonensis]